MIFLMHAARRYVLAAMTTGMALLTLSSACSGAADDGVHARRQETALAGVEQWFAAWELVSRDIYGIDTLRPVEFIFFDNAFIYSTSPGTGEGESVVDGPGLMNWHPVWRRTEQNGNIQLPDGQTIPVGVMSFAAPLSDREAGSFFVMPLPGFWQEAGVTSEVLGLDNLLTGVFLHEFSHSQQMHNFGADLSRFERSYEFKHELSDDIVQDYFADDEGYTSAFRAELALFFGAAHSDDEATRLALAREAMTLYRKRQQDYFTGDRATLARLDDFFLTMEGFGQYSIYAWLKHPQGGGFTAETAEEGVRRGGRWWSQEQGLALFLLLEKFLEPGTWAPLMFGNESVSAIDLIARELSATDEA